MSGFLPTGLNNPNANKSDVSRGVGFSGGPGPSTSTSLLERRLTSDGERGSFFNPSRVNGPTSLGVTALEASTSTPISPSSAMAHRDSRPSLDQSRSTTSRFTPNSRIPKFVRARRVEDRESVEPHLTTTAQRIIEILQRNTTPVLEGLKKVPIHTSVKTLKPIQRTVRGGPPITRSPYALGEGSPKSLPVPPPYLLPKVPSQNPSPSTSTAVQQLPPTIAKTTPFAPLPIGTVSTVSTQDFNYEGEPKSSGGGKIKGKTTRIHEHVPHHQRPPIPPPRETPLPVRKELVPVSRATPTFSNVIVQMDSADSGPSRFNIGRAWPSSLYDPGTRSLPNGYPEEDGFWKRLFAVVEGGKGGNTFKTSSALKPTATLALTESARTGQATTWPCPTCMISNQISELKCVSCTETQPAKYSGSAAEAGALEPSSWPCPICMVANKIADSKCVCCTEARPAKYSGMSGAAATLTTKPVTTTPAPATWPCPTCMVGNKITDANCVCCTETRPAKFSAIAGTSTTSAPSAPPATGFTFGFSAQPTSTATPAPPPSSISTFSFGLAAPKTTDSPPPFKFGVPTTSSSESAPPAIKFGVPSTTSGHSTTTAGFQFGLSTPVTTPKPHEPEKSPEKSPMSADSFRKGFSFSKPTEANGNTTSTISPTPPIVKSPVVPPPLVEEKKDPDAEIEKYKFKPFSGGPKPIAPTLPPETKPQVTFGTPLVSAAPTPTSFGVNLPSSPPPTVNGGIDTVDKPKPAVAFSFGLANSTPLSPTTTATGSVPTSTPFSFGVTTTAAIPVVTTTTTTTTGGFTFGAVPTNTATAATPAPPVNFSFGTGESHKRKAPSEDTPGAGFTFNPSEPKLKMRVGADGGINAVVPSSQSPPGGGMKTGSFLDAMKQPGFGSVDKPDGKLLNNAFSLTNNNNTTSSVFTNPNAGFQFQPSVQPPPPPPVVPSGGFNYGAAQIPAPLQPSTFNNNNVGFTYGQQPSPYNLVPNLSFGQNPGAPPSSGPVLFNAGAPPPSQVNDIIGRRPRKTAVRRFR